MAKRRSNLAGAALRPEDRSPDWSALGAAPPFGEARVGLDVAGIRVRVQGLSPAQVAWYRGRFGIFAADGEKPGSRVDLQVRRAPAQGFLQLDRSGGAEIYRMATEHTGDRLRCWSYWFAGWLDAAGGRGEVAISEEGGRGFESSLENFLRVVYATLALERGGFVLHSAGLVHDGRAHLLFGPSGAGKTTSTELASGARVLSDDLILILPGGDGPRAVSIPFRGVHAELPPAQASFPVAGFYRLVQSPEVFLEPLPAAHALGELCCSLPFVTERPENSDRILDVLQQALRAAPAFRLHFRKDPAFWELITGRHGAPPPPAGGRP